MSEVTTFFGGCAGQMGLGYDLTVTLFHEIELSGGWIMDDREVLSARDFDRVFVVGRPSVHPRHVGVKHAKIRDGLRRVNACASFANGCRL